MNQNEYYVGYAVCYDWACVATTAAIARALFSMAGAAYWRGEGEDCHGHGSGDMRDMPTTWSREKGERKEKREKNGSLNLSLVGPRLKRREPILILPST